MAKRSKRVFSTLICTKCNSVMIIPRPTNRIRPEGHIKTMYCGICKAKQDFIENNTRTLAEVEALHE